MNKTKKKVLLTLDEDIISLANEEMKKEYLGSLSQLFTRLVLERTKK